MTEAAPESTFFTDDKSIEPQCAHTRTASYFGEFTPMARRPIGFGRELRKLEAGKSPK
jgi:hypothetical protein